MHLHQVKHLFFGTSNLKSYVVIKMVFLEAYKQSLNYQNKAFGGISKTITSYLDSYTVAYLGFYFGGGGGGGVGSKYFWKSGGICMVQNAMQCVC